jgi:hypothetical protein
MNRMDALGCSTHTATIHAARHTLHFTRSASHVSRLMLHHSSGAAATVDA